MRQNLNFPLSFQFFSSRKCPLLGGKLSHCTDNTPFLPGSINVYHCMQFGDEINGLTAY